MGRSSPPARGLRRGAGAQRDHLQRGQQHEKKPGEQQQYYPPDCRGKDLGRPLPPTYPIYAEGEAHYYQLSTDSSLYAPLGTRNELREYEEEWCPKQHLSPGLHCSNNLSVVSQQQQQQQHRKFQMVAFRPAAPILRDPDSKTSSGALKAQESRPEGDAAEETPPEEMRSCEGCVLL